MNSADFERKRGTKPELLIRKASYLRVGKFMRTAKEKAGMPANLN